MNVINWFEIPAADFERARNFYEAIFATSLKLDSSFPGCRMAIWPNKCPAVNGCILEMAEARPHQDGVRIYLNGGEDLAPILDRVSAAGGQVLMPKTLLREDIGHIALFADSEGNVIGLHSMG